MAEDEQAAFQRLVTEKAEIEAEFANMEARGLTAEARRAEQQDAALASLERLEREKRRREKARKAEAERKEQEEQTLLAYEKAKAALASKEKAKNKVESA